MAKRKRPIHSDALVLLEIEHGRLSQILDAIDGELEKVGRGDAMNLDLIGQALTYLTSFPDACHHPKEDLIARKLSDKGGAEPPPFDLEAEHQELRELTNRVFEVHQSGSDDLPAALRDFVRAYRRHIEIENTSFFPHALQTLTQDDFDVIDFRVFDAPDPVFDVAEEARFAVLRHTILGDRDQLKR